MEPLTSKEREAKQRARAKWLRENCPHGTDCPHGSEAYECPHWDYGVPHPDCSCGK